MASVAGITCDQCGTFATAPPQQPLPPRWLQLVIHGSPRGKETFDLCSSKCVRDLGRARMEAERELAAPPSKRKSPAYVGRGAHLPELNHRRHHTLKGVVKDGCEFCEAATMPTNGKVPVG